MQRLCRLTLSSSCRCALCHSALPFLFIVLLTCLHPAQSISQSQNFILKADTASCQIPFTLVGKLIIIQASADSSSGNFILDTGSPGLVLNSTYFRDYPTHSAHNTNTLDINGENEQLQQTTIPHFTLGTFHYYRMGADLLSLSHLEQSRGIKILGLIGVSFFKDCELIIDYVNKLIHLHHINKSEAKTYRHDMLSNDSRFNAYPIELKENRILLKTRIGKRDLKFAIDYAAETSILDSRLPEKILDSVQIYGRILLTGAGSRKIEALSGELSGLQIGNELIPILPVIVTRLENTCFGGMNCINGVLGYDFMSRSIIALNFRKRILYILK
jgi:hypothetical protein